MPTEADKKAAEAAAAQKRAAEAAEQTRITENIQNLTEEQRQEIQNAGKSS